MAGFPVCPECEGESYCQHQINAGSRPATSRANAKKSEDGGGVSAPSAARKRLLDSAGAVFEAIDALVGYRVHQPFNRDRNERLKIAELSKRFAHALVDFARELELVRRPRPK